MPDQKVLQNMRRTFLNLNHLCCPIYVAKNFLLFYKNFTTTLERKIQSILAEKSTIQGKIFILDEERCVVNLD